MSNLARMLSAYQGRWFLALLLAAACLWFPALHRAITYDEAVTFIYYAGSPIDALGRYDVPNNHMLHSLLVWISASVFGSSEIAIRLPAFLAALLSLCCIYRIGTRLRNPSSGLFAAALLVATNGMMLYATQARGYSLSVLLVLLLFERVYWYSYARRYETLLCCTGLMLTLPTLIMPIVGLALWALWCYRRLALRVLLPMATGTLCGALFYLPWIAHMPHYANPFAQTILDGGMLFAGAGSAVVLGSIGIGSDKKYLMACGCVIGATVALSGGLLGVGSLPFARNYLYLAPFVCLAASLAKLDVSDMRRMSAAILVVAALSTPAPAPDVERLVALVDHALPDNAVVVPGCCVDAPLRYYRPAALSNHPGAVYVVIETPADPRDTILARYGLVGLRCTVLDTWAPFWAWACR